MAEPVPEVTLATKEPATWLGSGSGLGLGLGLTLTLTLTSVRAILAMVRPDWHLLVFAYASLVVAAAGDTTIPFLYGQLIDAIAINRDPDKFTTYMLLLVLTAVVTGVFTGFRGSTFIVIGGRFSVP